MKNELIRELAKRAHEDVRSDEEANGVCFKDYNLQFQKAFAKLLILECKENFAKVWYEQGLDIRGAELDKFLTRFEKHLGVEE